MYIQIKVNQEKSFKSQPWNCSKNVLQQFHEQQNEWKFVFSIHRLISPSIFISVQILKIMAFLSFPRSVSMFEAGNGSYSKCHCLLCEDSITWIILGLRTYVFPGNEYATHDRRFYYGDFNCYQFNIF